MPIDIHPIDSYQFRDSDEFLADANIWLYIFGPQAPDDWKTKVYSKAYSSILSARGRIYVDVLILSEFINRYARLIHQITKPEEKFKDYRNSPEFKPVARDIEASVRGMLKYCRRTAIGFPACDMDALLSKFGEGDSDFNDQLLVELCKEKGFKFITHDGDFKDCGLTILTANKKLLSQ